MANEPSVSPPQPTSSSPSSSNSRLGNSVIPIVNKLQDIFAQLGSLSTIELPQVAVVGSESSIEHFVRNQLLMLWPVLPQMTLSNGDYVLEGSEGTPFAGGYYYGKIMFPPEYPYKPPGISSIHMRESLSIKFSYNKAVQKLLGERKKQLDSISSRLQVKERQLEQQGKEIGLIELFEHTPTASDINRH